MYHNTHTDEHTAAAKRAERNVVRACMKLLLKVYGHICIITCTQMSTLPRPKEQNATWCLDALMSLKPLAEKLHWLYTNDDHWAPLEQVCTYVFINRHHIHI